MILVTGGSGFIGTHLIQSLVTRSKVVNIDLRPSSFSHPHLTTVIGDVRDPACVGPWLKNEKLEAVIHLAAIASVVRCQEEPNESYSTNLQSTALLLDLMSGDPRVIFASSAAVYGKLGDVHPHLREEMALEQPLSHYAVQKRACEQMLGVAHVQRDLPAINFRFFNVFGEGQDPTSPYSGVITLFRKQIMAGEPLKIFGTGEQSRDFVHVSDVVRGIESALTLPKAQCDAQPINLATGTRVSVRELAETMLKLVPGSRSKIEFLPARGGDVFGSCADVSRAKRVLNWQASVRLETGLSGLFR